jgi:hypothetical protein
LADLAGRTSPGRDEVAAALSFRIDTLTGGAKSTAPQRILSDLRSSENHKSRDLADGVDLVPAQGVSAVKRDLGAGFAWDRAPGVTELTAASLAYWGLLSATQPTPKRSPPPLM